MCRLKKGVAKLTPEQYKENQRLAFIKWYYKNQEKDNKKSQLYYQLNTEKQTEGYNQKPGIKEYRKKYYQLHKK